MCHVWPSPESDRRFPASWINDATRAAALKHVAEHRLDVIVIGGGITGAGVALDAASRGLSVALVESHDLASGTSGFSSKLVHGGLRYLASGDVAVAWESAIERARLMRFIAPHLVHRRAFLIPSEHGSPRSEYVLSGIGVAIADLMRHATGLPGSILPGPRHVNAATAHRLAPALAAGSLRGGVLYFDGQLEDDARLVLAVARTAAKLGAHIIRDALAVSATDTSVIIDDRRSDTRLVLEAQAVINATGVWAADLDPQLSVLPSRGSHLVVRSARLGHPKVAYTAPVPGHFGRFVFVLPQPDGLCYIGITDQEDHTMDGRHPVVPDSDVAFLLDIVGRTMEHPLTPVDVVGTFAGLRPLAGAGGDTSDVSRRHLVNDIPGNPISIIGGKLTTYRRMAEDAVDAAVTRIESGDHPCRTNRLPLVGAADARYLSQLRARSAARLVRRFGTEAPEVTALAGQIPDVAGPLYEGCPVLGEELLFGVLAEGASDIDDLLERRTRLSLVPTEAARARGKAERILGRGRELLQSG